MLKILFATLILLTLSACGSRDSRLAIQHGMTSSGGGATVEDKAVTSLLASADCLPLDELITLLSKRDQDRITVYLRNSALLSVADGTPLSDSLTTGQLLLKDHAPQALIETQTGNNLMSSTLAHDYLNNVVQKDCESASVNGVTYHVKDVTKSKTNAKGAVVAIGSRGVLSLQSLDKSKTILYRDDGQNLYVTLDQVVNVTPCNRPKDAANYNIHEELVIHHGDGHEVRLNRNFLQLMKDTLVSSPKDLDKALSQSPAQTLVRKIHREAGDADLITVPYDTVVLLQSLIHAGQFKDLQCK